MSNKRSIIFVAVVFIALSAVLLVRFGAKNTQMPNKTQESGMTDEALVSAEDQASGWQAAETAQEPAPEENGDFQANTTPQPTTMAEAALTSTTMAQSTQAQSGTSIYQPTATAQPGSTSVVGASPTPTTGSTLAPTSTPTPTQTAIPTDVFTPYDWTGQWTAFFGDEGGLLFRATMVVERTGNTITGTHSTQIFTGTLSDDGLSVSGTWVNPPASGTFYWKIINDNQFCGNTEGDFAYCAARRGASRPDPCICRDPDD